VTVVGGSDVAATVGGTVVGVVQWEGDCGGFCTWQHDDFVWDKDMRK